MTFLLDRPSLERRLIRIDRPGVGIIDKSDRVSGIVTIEDVIEEIIGEEIVDEFDRFDNMQKASLSKEGNRVSA